MVSLTPHSYSNGNNPPYPLGYEVERAPEPVWRFWRRGESLTATGFWNPHHRTRRL